MKANLYHVYFPFAVVGQDIFLSVAFIQNISFGKGILANISANTVGLLSCEKTLKPSIKREWPLMLNVTKGASNLKAEHACLNESRDDTHALSCGIPSMIYATVSKSCISV